MNADVPISPWRRLSLKRIAAAIGLLALCWPGATAAQSDQDRALKARQAGAAKLPSLRRMVEQRVGGNVVGVRPIGSGANVGYRFKVLRGADVVSVTVNAKSGAIMSIKEPR